MSRTWKERAEALLAADKLTTAMQVRAVEMGLLTADQCSTAAQAEIVNATTIRSQAQTALQANRDFVALTSPTNAQVVAQVKALSRQNNALIRLALKQLDAAD